VLLGEGLLGAALGLGDFVSIVVSSSRANVLGGGGVDFLLGGSFPGGVLALAGGVLAFAGGVLPFAGGGVLFFAGEVLAFAGGGTLFFGGGTLFFGGGTLFFEGGALALAGGVLCFAAAGSGGGTLRLGAAFSSPGAPLAARSSILSTVASSSLIDPVSSPFSLASLAMSTRSNMISLRSSSNDSSESCTS
jgi:hypothetical protein